MSAPALVPAVVFVAGVVCGLLGEEATGWLPAGLVLAWGASVACLIGHRPRGLLVAVVAGFIMAGWADGAARSRLLVPPGLRELATASGSTRPTALVEGRLVRDAVPTDYGASLTLDLEQATVGRRRRPVSGGVRVSVGGSFVTGRLLQWRAGRRLRLPVQLRRPPRYWNPGTGDQEVSLTRRSVVLLGSTKSALLIEVVARGGFVEEAAAAIRAAVRERVWRTVGHWGHRSAAIIVALLIGDRAGLDPDVLDRLRDAGTYHVLAISGGNIAILAGIVLLLMRGIGAPPRLAAAMTALLLAGYAVVVGRDASVVRATLVALVYLGARSADLGSAALNAVALAALVILAIDPAVVFDVGFTLSFGATLGIVLGVARCLAGLKRLAGRAGTARLPSAWVDAGLGLLAATICAEAALLPVSALIFSRISVAGLGLNFLAIPLMSVAQIAGLAAVVLAGVHRTLGVLAGFVGHLAAELLVGSAGLVDLLPGLAMRVPPPPLWLVTGYYAALGAWLFVPSGRRVRPVAGLAAALALLAIGAGLPVGRAQAGRPPAAGGWRVRGWLQVVALDVDQGDATFVTFPDGTTLLADAGGAPGGRFPVGERVVLPALWSLGVRRLDYFAFTHGDPDHIGGAGAVIDQLSPAEVWEGVPVPSSEPIADLRRRAVRVGSRWRAVTAGYRLVVGGARLVVRHPPPPDWERQRVRNDDSIVLEIVLGRVSLLLTGDAGAEVERSLAGRLPPAGFRILKVPHHGSRTSSSMPFLEAASPGLAFVSAGRKSRFGHPAPEVLERYRRVGAAIFRTDRDGAIWMATDGTHVVVRSMSGRYLSRRVPLPGSRLALDASPRRLQLVE